MSVKNNGFDRICDYPLGVIQRALMLIPDRTLVLALCGASPRTVATIESVLSEYGIAQIAEQVSRTGCKDELAIKAAQNQILKVVGTIMSRKLFSAQFIS